MNKRTLKKILTAALIVSMIAALAGCGKKEQGTQSPLTSEAAAQETTSQVTSEANTQSADTKESSKETAAETQKATEEETEKKAEGPIYYTMDDIDALENTENFSGSAIEHIFNGSVNSQGKGSGYHYDMVEGSDGEIIEGTRSKEDINGIYTAYVEVSGHRKDHYSSFFPDEWSPQEVVDAINIARQDALDNDRSKGSTWIGYYGEIEIDMYLDSKDRVVSAFPVHEDDKR